MQGLPALCTGYTPTTYDVKKHAACILFQRQNIKICLSEERQYCFAFLTLLIYLCISIK